MCKCLVFSQIMAIVRRHERQIPALRVFAITSIDAFLQLKRIIHHFEIKLARLKRIAHLFDDGIDIAVAKYGLCQFTAQIAAQNRQTLGVVFEPFEFERSNARFGVITFDIGSRYER